MQCPSCGHPEMEQKTRDETLSYGGHSMTLHGMKGEFCPICGEGVWDSESYKRLVAAQTAVVDATRSGVAADIRRIRKRLKLTQAQLAKTFGVGKMAFSRYEQGKTQPPAYLVKLLRLIERHPELLTEMQEIAAAGEHSAGEDSISTRTRHERSHG